MVLADSSWAEVYSRDMDVLDEWGGEGFCRADPVSAWHSKTADLSPSISLQRSSLWIVREESAAGAGGRGESLEY